MYIIEKYITSETINDVLVENTWVVSSAHTLESDRDTQKQRFLDNGIALADIRYTEV